MKLKELRNLKQLSQKELGKIIGVSGQTILNWENNIYNPNINYLIKLADYFRVSIDYLVDRKTTISTSEIVCNELKKIKSEELIGFIRSKINK